MIRFASLALLLLASLTFSTAHAFAERRVALVIGNSAYQNSPRLANPENDASAIGLLLKNAGFDVVEVRQNLSGADMRRSIRDFSETTKDADIALVFYAGHGIEVGGTNYLIPVDAALRRDVDVEDEAVSLDRILSLLEPAKRLRLVILDACRDNPFASKMSRTLASRAVGRGLARVEPPGSDTLIAYSARAGSVAADGDGANSPFTAALLRNLTTPGLDIRLAFGRVHDEVLSRTDRKQEPFVYGALGGSTISLVPTEPQTGANASGPPADPDAPASRDYEFAAKVGTKDAWDSFLVKHPAGFYSDLARSQLVKLTSSVPSEPSPETKSTVPEATKKAGKTASLPPATAADKKPGRKCEPAGAYVCMNAAQKRSYCADIRRMAAMWRARGQTPFPDGQEPMRICGVS